MVTQFNKGWVYLDHPLHRAGHALDPEHQAQNWHIDTYITDALEDVIQKYYGDDNESAAAAERQLEKYRTREGRLGRKACVMNMHLMSGWSWWAKYGGHCPELQAVAMDVLSLVCGACSCERNWSAFDFIHSKKRNKLSATKAADLVYVFSNLRLLRKLNAADSTEVFYAWASDECSKESVESLEKAVGSAALFAKGLSSSQFEQDVSSDEDLEVEDDSEHDESSGDDDARK